MPRPRADDQHPTAPPRSSEAPPKTELTQQRAGSEGIPPSESQAEAPPQNEGEGSRTADRSYRRGVRRFLAQQGRSREAAERAARAVEGPEGAALQRAEDAGRQGPNR